MSQEEDREIADRILKNIEKQYGFIPVVNKVLSERPDIFIPAINYSKAVLENPDSEFDSKTRYLLSISAASALGSPHCLETQVKHATSAGANRNEVIEAMLIGSYMSMTRSQSYALREFDRAFNKNE